MRKRKIAISLAPEIVHLVDKHAHGQSRSQFIEDELARASRTRVGRALVADVPRGGRGAPSDGRGVRRVRRCGARAGRATRERRRSAASSSRASVIRRGFVYRVRWAFRDPKAVRFMLVMSSDRRNLDPRSPTVVAVPMTTRLKGTSFRVRLRKREGGLPETSEAACEQTVQVIKQQFVADAADRVLPIGPPVDERLLAAVVDAIVAVVSR